jgi:MFS family permease
VRDDSGVDVKDKHGTGLDRHPFLRVALLVGLSVLLGAITGAVRGEKTQFLLKEELHLNATGTATLGLLLGIPAYLQPFVGAWTDLFPLFGLRRRSYYLLGLLIAAGSTFILGFAHPYHYPTVACLLLLNGSGGVLTAVTYSAVMVAVGNRTGTFGRLQTVAALVPLVLQVVWTGHLGGYVAQHWSYEHTFTVAALLTLLNAPLVLLMEDGSMGAAKRGRTREDPAVRAERKRAERAQTAAALHAAARTRGLWVMVAYVFYLILTPGPNSLYYFADGLHFSKQFIGDLHKWWAAGTLLGMSLFAFLYRRLPVVALVWGAWLMDCAIYPPLWLTRDTVSAEWMRLIGGAVSVIYGLCLNTIAARACPPGIEGAIYGLVMAAIALGAGLTNQFGSWLYDFFGPANKAHHFTVIHGWNWSIYIGEAFTLAAGFLIPFLPDWARSREPLQPVAQGEVAEVAEALPADI